MIKTYIYGVPNGFDLYEKDAGLNDYFKGFYISSRRGRRLMVNRRDNGETIYSYLRYGLKEVERQPLHSFFGMSLVVDNYQYCPNFKVLLEWFDYLFNKLINEHSLIKKNEDGILHYVIHKFDENSADIEWLKSNLPNILTQTSQTEIANYDNSFVDGKAGQIVSFNHPVGENLLLETFRKYRWISISSEIVEQQDINTGEPIEIELSYEELSGKLNEFNQQLLPIAVDISKGSYADLKRMADEVQEISTSLVKYLPVVDDPEEKEKFGRLDSKYDSLKESIGTLLSKFSNSTKTVLPKMPKQETQYCFSCKQNKPLSHFSATNATKCIVCEEQDRRRSGTNIPKEYKICISCGKKKTTRLFNQAGTDICDDCAKEQKQNHEQEGLFEKTSKILMSKGFLGVFVAFVIVVGGIFVAINLTSGYSTKNIHGGCENIVDTTSTKLAATEETIDRQKLESLITSGDFKIVYEYVKDKKDAAHYKNSLKKAVQQYLISIVDASQSSENALESLGTFYVDNFQFLDYINWGAQEREYLGQFANDYFYVWNLIKKEKIHQQEKDKGKEILTKYTGIFPKVQDWMTTLTGKTTENQDTEETKVHSSSANTPGAISVSYTSKDNNPVKENVSGHREIFIKAGTYVTFDYPNGNIRTKDEVSRRQNGKKNKRTLNPENKIIVYCGKFGITITPYNRERFKE